MRIRAKLILAALAATALLAFAVGDAGARSFSFSERNSELIWNDALTGKTKFTFGDSAGHHIECNLTLLGRYSSNTMAKNTAVNQGTLNHGELEGCVNGTATIRTETMPWGLRYVGFTGRLPAIETIRKAFIGMSFRFRESGGLSCSVRTEELEPLVTIVEGIVLENLRLDETRTIRTGGEFLCSFASPAHVSGKGLITNLPRTANVTVTLI